MLIKLTTTKTSAEITSLLLLSLAVHDNFSPRFQRLNIAKAFLKIHILGH